MNYLAELPYIFQDFIHQDHLVEITYMFEEAMQENDLVELNLANKQYLCVGYIGF